MSMSHACTAAVRICYYSIHKPRFVPNSSVRPSPWTPACRTSCPPAWWGWGAGAGWSRAFGRKTAASASRHARVGVTSNYAPRPESRFFEESAESTGDATRRDGLIRIRGAARLVTRSARAAAMLLLLLPGFTTWQTTTPSN